MWIPLLLLLWQTGHFHNSARTKRGVGGREGALLARSIKKKINIGSFIWQRLNTDHITVRDANVFRHLRIIIRLKGRSSPGVNYGALIVE